MFYLLAIDTLGFETPILDPVGDWDVMFGHAWTLAGSGIPGLTRVDVVNLDTGYSNLSLPAAPPAV